MYILLIHILFCQSLFLRRSNANHSTTSENIHLKDGEYIGCYSNECLKFDYDIEEQDKMTTPDLCTTSCKNCGYSFAAAYNGSKCSCAYEYSCQNKSLNKKSCGIPCSGDVDEFCGSYIAASLYRVHKPTNINCSKEENTSTYQPTQESGSKGFLVQPVHIIYLSFTGVAFVVVIIVIVARTRRRRSEHDFIRTLYHHHQSQSDRTNMNDGTIHYTTQDMLDYPYDSLVRDLPPLPIPAHQRGAALPMTTCDWTSRSASRPSVDVVLDGDLRRDRCSQGNEPAAGTGCSNVYFTIVAEGDEEEDEINSTKGQVKGACSWSRPSCSEAE